MNCQQVQESLGDHSVGLLDTGAISAFETHVAICAECARSVREFHRCLELLDHAPRPTPPADLWLGVRARLELERSVSQLSQQAAATRSQSLWSGALAAMAGFAAAAGVLVLLSSQPGGGSAAVATVPPVAVSVSQHSLLDANSPVADGASVMAADAVSLRPIPGRVQRSRVIVPGRELLGEPLSSGDLGAMLPGPMRWSGAPHAREAAGDSRR